MGYPHHTLESEKNKHLDAYEQVTFNAHNLNMNGKSYRLKKSTS